MVERTNQGYVNSRVNLRLFVHCVEEYRGEEKDSDQAMVRAFKAYKVRRLQLQRDEKRLLFFLTFQSSVTELLGSADLAILLVKTYSYGGVAYLNSYKKYVNKKRTLSLICGVISSHNLCYIAAPSASSASGPPALASSLVTRWATSWACTTTRRPSGRRRQTLAGSGTSSRTRTRGQSWREGEMCKKK